MGLKVIVIDDERPAIRELEFLLREYDSVEVVGTFIDPAEAMESLTSLEPDLIFLDINLNTPGMSGLQTASLIAEQYCKVDIVFVTAYDHYAVEAFEVRALDYLLKPVQQHRLEKTIKRVLSRHIAEGPPTNGPRIQCFGSFQVFLDGENPIKWRSEKTKELFAFLVHGRGKSLSKDRLLDAIWPDVEPNRAVHRLHNGIYYIRKTLRDYGIKPTAVNLGNSYALQLSGVTIDVETFWKIHKGLAERAIISEMEELVRLYTGDYMGDCYWNWLESERPQFASIVQDTLISLARHYLMSDLRLAEQKALQSYNLDPYNEESSRVLIEVYQRTGEKGKALNHWRRLRKIFQDDLGVEPSKRLSQLINEI